MRVMIDTNVLFSALLFPKGRTAKAFEKVLNEHEVVISSYCINELKRIVAKKFPDRIKDTDLFLEKLSFILAYTPDNPKTDLFQIRDANDYPILYTAIIENVDVLLTGDMDFKDTNIDSPEILTPAEFLEKY
ncbi:MAG: putative toxin-antitoxin system toxin component, PIN family [Clostridia bacterium]|nr:putative toxin-antitoxin system toxin component, PIN family [Clostridia bacterium]